MPQNNHRGRISLGPATLGAARAGEVTGHAGCFEDGPDSLFCAAFPIRNSPPVDFNGCTSNSCPYPPLSSSTLERAAGVPPLLCYDTGYHLPDRYQHVLHLGASTYTIGRDVSVRARWTQFLPVTLWRMKNVFTLDSVAFILYVTWSAAPAVAAAEAVNRAIGSTSVLSLFVVVSNVVIGMAGGHGSAISGVRIAQVEALAGCIGFGLVIPIYVITDWSYYVTLPLLIFSLYYLLLAFGIMGFGFTAGVYDVLSVVFFTNENTLSARMQGVLQRVYSLMLGISIMLGISVITPPQWHCWQIRERARRWFESSFWLASHLIMNRSAYQDIQTSFAREADELIAYLDEIVVLTNVYRAKKVRRLLLQNRLGLVLGTRLLEAAADLGGIVQASGGGVGVAETFMRLPISVLARDVRRRTVPVILLPPFDIATLAQLTPDGKTTLEEQIASKMARVILLMSSVERLGYRGQHSVDDESITRLQMQAHRAAEMVENEKFMEYRLPTQPAQDLLPVHALPPAARPFLPPTVGADGTAAPTPCPPHEPPHVPRNHHRLTLRPFKLSPRPGTAPLTGLWSPLSHAEDECGTAGGGAGASVLVQPESETHGLNESAVHRLGYADQMSALRGKWLRGGPPQLAFIGCGWEASAPVIRSMYEPLYTRATIISRRERGLPPRRPPTPPPPPKPPPQPPPAPSSPSSCLPTTTPSCPCPCPCPASRPAPQLPPLEDVPSTRGGGSDAAPCPDAAPPNPRAITAIPLEFAQKPAYKFIAVVGLGGIWVTDGDFEDDFPDGL